jgi:hypothetical protein
MIVTYRKTKLFVAHAQALKRNLADDVRSTREFRARLDNASQSALSRIFVVQFIAVNFRKDAGDFRLDAFLL